VTASEPRPEIMQLLQEAAAVEREACARIAEEIARRWTGHYGTAPSHADIAGQIAAQIRARGAPMKEHGP